MKRKCLVQFQRKRLCFPDFTKGLTCCFFRFNMNETAIARAKTDGLNDLSYRMLGKNLKKTYTKLIIDIRRIDVTNITMYMDGKKAMDIDIAIAGLKCWSPVF